MSESGVVEQATMETTISYEKITHVDNNHGYTKVVHQKKY